MRSFIPVWIFGWAACLSIFSANAQSADAEGAKALFCTAEGSICSLSAKQPPAKPRGSGGLSNAGVVVAFGISYWIELQNPSGEISRVSVNKEFSTGDRIRLFVRPNQAGYLYIFNLGTSGRTTPLYPRVNDVARVEAGQSVAIPGSSFLRFAGPAGEENVLLVFSPRPISDLGGNGSPRQAGVDQGVVLAAANSNGSKDLMREDDFGGPGAEQASFAVASDAQRAINLTIRLKHR